MRAYAVGDIHGCLEETKALLERLKTDNDYRHETETYLIFLGDLIDRGPDSKGVIEYLLEFPHNFAEPFFIMGNHEEMMIRALSGEPGLLPNWLEYGGFECAESYGVPRSQLVGQDPHSQEYILRSAIPQEHLDFMSGFLDYVHFGDFLFTHAGVRPGVPVEQQNARDLRWIRNEFLHHNGTFDVMVVHGHTISDDIEVRSNRIGLDTGAYKSGKLSAVCVEDDNIAYFSTK